MIYNVFTDGSSSKLRKTIGTSYIVFKDKESESIKNFCKGFIDKQARNGIAELLGVYYFLCDIYCNTDLYIINKEDEIIIHSDSQYVVKEFTEWFRNQMMKNFFDTKNKEIIIYCLWMLDILRKEGYSIKFKWIRGHQKEETFEAFGNNCADELAVFSHKDINNLENIENIVEELKKEIKEKEILKKIRKSYLGI